GRAPPAAPRPPCGCALQIISPLASGALRRRLRVRPAAAHYRSFHRSPRARFAGGSASALRLRTTDHFTARLGRAPPAAPRPPCGCALQIISPLASGALRRRLRVRPAAAHYRSFHHSPRARFAGGSASALRLRTTDLP